MELVHSYLGSIVVQISVTYSTGQDFSRDTISGLLGMISFREGLLVTGKYSHAEEVKAMTIQICTVLLICFLTD